jgi:hypothetical protein
LLGIYDGFSFESHKATKPPTLFCIKLNIAK